MTPLLRKILAGKWLAMGVAVLVAAVAVLATIRFRSRGGADMPQTGPAVMAGLRSYNPPGWQVSEVPLGPNELSEKIVNQILRFDDAVFLHYRNGSREFAAYVAYWSPGKADMRTVNAHTPDTCWVNSGWQTREKQSGFKGFGAAANLPSGEYRCYSNQGTVQYVAFWHLLAGRPVKMWRNGFPTVDFMWSLFAGDRRDLAGEQYFIRISSPRPLDELWVDPAFVGILQRLEKSGLNPHAFAPR